MRPPLARRLGRPNFAVWGELERAIGAAAAPPLDPGVFLARVKLNVNQFDWNLLVTTANAAEWGEFHSLSPASSTADLLICERRGV